MGIAKQVGENQFLCRIKLCSDNLLALSTHALIDTGASIHLVINTPTAL